MLQSFFSTKTGIRWPTLASAGVLLALALLSWQSSAIGNLLGGSGSEPLAPEVAFVPEISRITDTHILVQFDIEDGYYLYRDKTSFSVKAEESVSSMLSGSSEGSLKIEQPDFPEAIIMNDDFFGEMATYRDSLSVSIPYSAAFGTQKGELSVKFQGCADIGLCYPPTTIKLPFDVPASAPTARSSAGVASLISANAEPGLTSPVTGPSMGESLFGSTSAQDELLPPELAYLPQITDATAQTINVRWFIEPGYYLYRHKLSFELEGLEGAAISRVDLDEGVDQHDEFYGDVKVFRHEANAALTLSASQIDTKSTSANLLINYQGCADIGVCFPPSKIQLPINFSQTGTVQNAVLGAPSNNTSTLPASSSDGGATAIKASTETTAAVQLSEQDRLFNLLESSSLWLTVATFFGFGLLLAFTPCVLPMVPILSSMIVGQGEKMSTMRAFQLSLIYVLVMASTYAIVGIIVGLSGYNVQAFLQNPWVLSVIAALFVILSLSMFGFYELQMPIALQEKLTKWSNKQGGGQVSGVAAMGFISTLIVGPCITAPLAGALIYIAKTGDAVIGGSALFALGLGMGAPLLLIGTSAGKLVPRAGAWMNTVKHIFGIIMLAMAIYMISRFIPSTATVALFGVLAVMSGIHLGATDTLNSESSGWQRFGKGFGILIALYGVALLIGALSGNSSYTTPLKGMAVSGVNSEKAETHGLAFTPVKSVTELDIIIANASRENRPVMLDFYADWCISCKEMEAFTFTDSTVQELLKNAVLVQADVTANDELDQAMLKRFDLFGPPGIIFYNVNGIEIRPARVVGFMSADKFSTHIESHIGAVSI